MSRAKREQKYSKLFSQLVLRDFTFLCSIFPECEKKITVASLSSQEEVCLAVLGQRTLWLVPFPLVLQLLWGVQAPSSPQLQYQSTQLKKNLWISWIF